MKVLVLGTRGQVARELLQAARPAGVGLVGAGRPQVDMTRPETLAAALDTVVPQVVINATAYTAVDRAESEPDLAFAVNRDGPARLAALCATRGVPLLHLSTDYVFDGRKTAPYTEEDPVAPVSVYGASKAAGEDAVRTLAPRHMIVRTAWVYAAHGHNFVRTMLRLGQERAEVAVVDDQHGNPTAAAALAAALVVMALRAAGREAAPWGTWHFAGTGATTWHGLAEQIFRTQHRLTGHRPRLKAIPSSAYPTPARRPANACLDCTRIHRTFGVMAPPWPESLGAVLDVLLEERK